ncbi:hypothetical protein CFC21_099415 [Triticum aestivum]|uniref:GRF-type domain-containing protein n=2 Tax=Triticum aestivum TaxID=4565 RepID=A0A9R1N1T9_WHEAT|nr:hypothetical protein CFC21_099415 [Triticum aestivum]
MVASSSASLSLPVQAPISSGMLSLVVCPCYHVRDTIVLRSKSIANPGRVFHKCPNHRVGTNPCQHYYWEDGPDNYFDFLVKKGHISIARTGRSGGISGHSLGDIESEEAEEEEDRGVEVQKICNGVMIDVVKKLDDLICLVRMFLFCIVTLLVVMVYVVALK